jgi:hypothetical protein
MRPWVKKHPGKVWTLAGALVILGVGVLIGLRWGATPEVGDQLFGWAGPEVATEEVARLQPPVFRLSNAKAIGDDSNKSKRVALWEYAKQINGGNHLPTYRQEIGDCVSMGSANAVNYLQAVQIILRRSGEKFRPAYQPWIFGTSRHDIGRDRLGCCKNGRCDGSVGLWAVKALSELGVLFADEPGLDPYSGKVANAWNCGPPQKWYPVAKQRLVKSYGQVRNAGEVRDALCNGYPVILCSMVGYVNKPPVQDGRLVGKRSGKWGHCTVLIAYDGGPTAKQGPYYYLLNSWGADFHGTPPDGAPPGGFWIRDSDVNAMVGEGDSWALSAFDGFPKQELEFGVVQTKAKQLPSFALAF